MPVAKALPSGAGLSAHDRALIKGIASAVHEDVRREIEKAVAPLLARIEELERKGRRLVRSRHEAAAPQYGPPPGGYGSPPGGPQYGPPPGGYGSPPGDPQYGPPPSAS